MKSEGFNDRREFMNMVAELDSPERQSKGRSTNL